MLPLSPSFATLKASLSPLPSAPRPVLYKPPGTKPGSPPGRTVASAALQKPKSFDVSIFSGCISLPVTSFPVVILHIACSAAFTGDISACPAVLYKPPST